MSPYLALVMLLTLLGCYLLGRRQGFTAGHIHGRREVLESMQWNTSKEGQEENARVFDEC